MKTLLSEDSPKYKRRLVREIKKVLINGSVYAVSHNFGRITDSRKIMAARYNKQKNKISITFIDGITTYGDVFKTGSGEIICASKE